MHGIEFGVTCEACFEQKPDVRYDRGVRKHLCNSCWRDVKMKDGLIPATFKDQPRFTFPDAQVAE